MCAYSQHSEKRKNEKDWATPLVADITYERGVRYATIEANLRVCLKQKHERSHHRR
jgi:hypothetical protein